VFVVRHPGAVLVLLGVAGEGVEIFCKILNRPRSEKFTRILDIIGGASWIVVVVGLMIEMNEDARLDNEFSATESKVEKLRNANDELEAREHPRVITTEQRTKFLSIVDKWPKSPVKIFVGILPNSEVYNYANHILSLLVEAGYGASNTSFIVRQDLTDDWRMPYPYNTNAPIEKVPIFMIFGATNSDKIDWPGISFYMQDIVTGRARIIGFKTNDVRAVPAMVDYAFQKIDIPTRFLGITNLLKKGEWAILIPTKNF
jgi:hypothetical protein